MTSNLSSQNRFTESQDIESTGLADGDRVVFVGNSLIEEAQQYGILEFMLLCASPENKITFRNLGWSGDSAEGSARSYISTPPQPFDLLVQQIQSAKPDWVVLGYGSIEAYKGTDGLEHYDKILNILLDTIDRMGAKSILLSTIPQVPPQLAAMHDGEIAEKDLILQERNTHLSLYSMKTKEIAASRNITYVDVFTELQKQGSVAYKDNGIHLNEQGYYILSKALIRSLGQRIQEWNVRVNAKTQEVFASGSMIVTNPQIDRTGLQLTVIDGFLPLEAGDVSADKKLLIIQGLKRGVYNLSIDHENIVSATAKDWAKGVEIKQGDAFERATRVLQKLAEINELYFWEYRPLNRTYLVGMRKYEQGQNSYELGVNSLFIDRLEKQIVDLTKPRQQHYQLTQIK